MSPSDADMDLEDQEERDLQEAIARSKREMLERDDDPAIPSTPGASSSAAAPTGSGAPGAAPSGASAAPAPAPSGAGVPAHIRAVRREWADMADDGEEEDEEHGRGPSGGCSSGGGCAASPALPSVAGQVAAEAPQATVSPPSGGPAPAAAAPPAPLVPRCAPWRSRRLLPARPPRTHPRHPLTRTCTPASARRPRWSRTCRTCWIGVKADRLSSCRRTRTRRRRSDALLHGDVHFDFLDGFDTGPESADLPGRPPRPPTPPLPESAPASARRSGTPVADLLGRGQRPASGA
jgi:hypothetical protein